MCKQVFRSAILLFTFVIAYPAIAFASCFSGSADWNDVRLIHIVRCQPSNPFYPCYSVYLQRKGSAISGYMVAARSSRGAGVFFTAAGNRASGSWAQVLGLIKQADFFQLEILNPKPEPGIAATIRADAPQNQITVTRCHTHVTKEADVEFDNTSQGWKRFMLLINGLQNVIDGLAWQRKGGEAKLDNIEQTILP